VKRIHLGYAGAIVLMVLAIHTSIAGEKPAPHEVAIDNFSFMPQTLTVPVGTTVTWINHDDIPHTVLSVDKTTIVSPALDTDEKFSYTFTATGTNDYYCSVHPHMKGKVIVVPAETTK
jgi:plastocyanin